MARIDITPEMIHAFGEAWAEADPPHEVPPGTRRRAGLEAALRVAEKDYHILPKGYRPEGTMLELDAIVDKWLQMCPVCDAGLPGTCTHPNEDYRPMLAELVATLYRHRDMVLQPRTLDPLEQRGEGGWIQLVAWLMDQLGQREVLVPGRVWEEDHRQLSFWQDFLLDGYRLQVSTAVDHIPPATEEGQP